MAEDAIANEAAHARAIQDKDREIRMLKQRLGSASASSSDGSSQYATTKTGQPRAEPKQPVLVDSNEGEDDEEADTIQYLYEGTSDRLKQATAEVYLMRAGMAESRGDWLAMMCHTNDALASADPLDYIPFNARCIFYRGIALFHLGELWRADEDFEFARQCIAIYKSEAEVEAWVSVCNLAISNGGPELAQRPSWAPLRTPKSAMSAQDSTHAFSSGQALGDELGSALASSAFSSMFPESAVASARLRGAPSRTGSLSTIPQIGRRATTGIRPSSQQLSGLQKSQSLRQRKDGPLRPRAETSNFVGAITEKASPDLR